MNVINLNGNVDVNANEPGLPGGLVLLHALRSVGHLGRLDAQRRRQLAETKLGLVDAALFLVLVRIPRARWARARSARARVGKGGSIERKDGPLGR